MLEYLEKKEYKKAMEIADTIDWRRVKSASMLNTVSEIYEYNNEYQKSRDILFTAFDRSPGSRKIVYRLGMLALKINDVEEASDCYEEYVKLAPRDPNQYILKYKILRAQGAPLTEQIQALEEFKKAEYVEKWAYELAALYHEAGMTAECLEECDDLILWFSEGEYVYKAMELKMKYKPLTPLQQEKYDSRPGAVKKVRRAEAVKEAEEVVEAEVSEAEEAVEEEIPETEEVVEEEISETEEAVEEEVSETEEAVEEEIPEAEEAVEEVPEAEEIPSVDLVREVEEMEGSTDEPEEKKHSAITQVVRGATLEEALATGVALASGINIEKEAMEKKEEDLRITSQMRIDDILQEWEEKQKEHAQAIAEQKVKDEERLQKEREEADRRKEEERKEVERKAAEAERARKAAEAEKARKAAEAEEARKAAEAEEARKVAEAEKARKAAEAEEARKAAEAEKARKAAEAAEAGIAGEGKTQRIPDDLVRLVAEMNQNPEQEDSEPEDEEFWEDFDEEDLDEDDLEEALDEDEFEEEDFDEEDFEEDFGEEALDEDEFEEEDFDEEDFDEDEAEEDFDEEDFDEDEAEEDFDEDEFDEEDFEEEDFDEDEFDEEDFEEEDFDEDEFDEEDFEEEDFDGDESEEDLDEEDFEDDEPEEEAFDVEDLEIEEPSEEEIQERIKKSKGSGVPFDTGFVVTGRYDLSATSEIGLKAGLTEEQKKLFSYFVPVRGMSEQIVEVLDNDRRAQREGTSKTGNLLVVGRKGSGKTVLAVDIVKAIQKQRNLKQGKVAIVTGESLNKKELTNIIQKLKGGAIIIEKAGKLNSRTIKELNYLMEKKTGELLFVLEDQRKPLERMLAISPEFKKKFTSRLELPVFINDELVTFGQTYAKENGYKLDEMGILALYSRIDVMQREDHAVSVAEVKEIMDEAIEHSQKANVKHLARRVFKKGTDESDRIILKEEDFKI
ncbi:hypothetical protein [uncultured Merdimonas sp.]|uniref:tetratricopeptide repeat protein n=1 Tax=uncultured Merdimonas sp. TaxID=2023269 RepID=UPI003209BCD4